MPALSNRILTAAALAAMAATGGCAKTRAHHGYVTDVDLANSIRPGVDNRDSVLGIMGRPTLASQYSKGDWYYVTRDVSSYAYNNPKPQDATVLRVHFDGKGTVTSVDKTGMELVASIDPSSKKTPTLGRERGFFEELFGNIGRVTPGGLGGASGGGGPGRRGP